MGFELKEGLSFPPKERELDQILLKIARESEKGQYLDCDLLNFLKTGYGLYSREDECRGMDDAISVGFEEEREDIIKKYIRIISFLWQDQTTEDIELHIEHSFNDIQGIDIQEEIEIGRELDISKIRGATKGLVFNLVDSKSLLENSEVVEFDTPEEIFFFVLNLLGLEKLAAYLNGAGGRAIIAPINPGEIDSIIQFLEEIGDREVIAYLRTKQIPADMPVTGKTSLDIHCERIGIIKNDLKKIKLIKKES